MSVLASSALAAPPSNDAFSAASVLASGLASPLTGDALGATYEANEPILDSRAQNGSLWFKWTPAAAGTGFAVPTFTWEEDATATVNDSGFEMVVYRGASMSALTPLARGSENSPIQRFAYSLGQTYYIQVCVDTGASAATFPWRLVLDAGTAAPSAPANDAFASAVVISTPLPRSVNGSTEAATLESGESIETNLTRSVWYRFTGAANSTRSFTISSTVANSYPQADLFTGTTLQNLTRVARLDADGEVLISSTSSTAYYIRVFNDDSLSAPGAFTLTVAAAPAGAAPGNNAFASATNLGSVIDGTTVGSTFKASLEAGEKSPMGTNATVWFKWTAPAAGWYAVSAASDILPPGIAVWSGTTLTNLKLKKSSDSTVANSVFKASNGETVYFQAGAEGGYGGDFTISVSLDVDPGLPQLTAVGLSSTSVNVTSADQPVTVTLNLEGAADGFISSVQLLHPNGGVVGFAETADLVQTSGTPGNGTFTANLTIPKGAAPGAYPLVIALANDSGVVMVVAQTGLITAQSPIGTWTSYMDIPTGPDSLTVTNSGTADAAPALTSFSVTPASADLGTGDAVFTFRAVVTDAQGVDAVTLGLNDPAGTLGSDALDLALTAGTVLNGTWTGTITIPRFTSLSRIDLTLVVSDSIGQIRQFGIQPENGPLSDKFSGRLQVMTNAFVTLTNSLGPDDLPPQVSEVSLTPNPATFGSNGELEVAVSVRVKDTVSGTDEVNFSLDSAVQFLLPRISGTSADGVYGATVKILRADSAPGVQNSTFTTTDLSGNNGITTSIVPGIPSLTLLAPTEGTYDRWAFDYALESPDEVAAANPSLDGISNTLKYAFNLDPTVSVAGEDRVLLAGTGLSGLPNISQIGTGASTRLRVEYIRRVGATGITHQVEFATSMNGPGDWTPATSETVSPIDSSWERVVVEDTLGAGAQRRFGRVKVVLSTNR
jgi:hypothetical protein